jgi:hypothetical protein
MVVLRCVLCPLILLMLSGAASAEPIGVPLDLEIASAGEGADAWSGAEPALDLDFEPPAAALPQPPIAPAPARPESRAPTPKAPFSIGLDIRTRHEIGDEARQEPADEATLPDEVAGMVRRSTFGLKGTYHF